MSYILVRPSTGLLYPATDYLRTYLTETLSDKYQNILKDSNALANVVLDCNHIDKIDFTAAQVSELLFNSHIAYPLLLCCNIISISFFEQLLLYLFTFVIYD